MIFLLFKLIVFSVLLESREAINHKSSVMINLISITSYIRFRKISVSVVD